MCVYLSLKLLLIKNLSILNKKKNNLYYYYLFICFEGHWFIFYNKIIILSYMQKYLSLSIGK